MEFWSWVKTFLSIFQRKKKKKNFLSNYEVCWGYMGLWCALITNIIHVYILQTWSYIVIYFAILHEAFLLIFMEFYNVVSANIIYWRKILFYLKAFIVWIIKNINEDWKRKPRMRGLNNFFFLRFLEWMMHLSHHSISLKSMKYPLS